MRYTFYNLLAASLLSACISSPEGPTAAERRAEYHQSLIDQLASEQRTVHVTDSLIQAIVPQINTATSIGFEYEKTEYDDLGRFRPEGTDPGLHPEQTYLRSAVDDYGRTQLILTYCGAKSFVVTQLRLTSSDGMSVTTRSISPNDGSNYSYDIQGVHYQSITFAYAGDVTAGMTQDSTALANADTDNGALAFIHQHANDNRLSCHLVAANGREQQLSLTAKERQQMASTYELGLLLRESIRLQQENKTAALKVQYLQQRIASFERE